MIITSMSKEDFTKAELYRMTKSPAIVSVKAVEDGATMEPHGWVTFEDENAKGETSYMLSIIGTGYDGQEVVWSCRSQVFKNNFMDLWNMFDGAPFTLKKISGVSKAGREYVNCDLA